MSYSLSTALQEAVYTALTGDPAVSAVVGPHVYDAVPSFPVAETPEAHVLIGEERVRDRSSATSRGALHDFDVAVHARAEGFARAKAAAEAVCDALTGSPLALPRGHAVHVLFRAARADRGQGDRPRRVVLSFRAFLEDTN